MAAGGGTQKPAEEAKGGTISIQDLKALLEAAKFAWDLINQILPKDDKQFTWRFQNGPNLGAGTPLTFNLDRVDDEAELFFNGKSLGKIDGTRPLRTQAPVQKGPNLILLEIRNTGSGHWGAHLRADRPGGFYIDKPLSSSDTWVPFMPVIRRRFIWPFSGM